MEYRRLGRAGLKVSALSIGSWVTYGGQVDDGAARRCLLAAYEGGVNFFDNAEAYAGGEAELVVGRVLRELRRESLVISSKVFWGGSGPNDRGLSRKRVVEACHAALRRLQVDYLDLYLCHRPDPDTPLDETVRAMDDLVRQGKVLYWGTSEWSAVQVEAAYATAEALGATPPSVEQPQYHMFHRRRVEQELAPLYASRGLGTTTWSPLASGLLTGKYNDGVPEGSRASMASMSWLVPRFTADRIATVRELTEVADDLGCSMAQLALAWAVRDPTQVSTVITGASRAAQVEQNLASLDFVASLTPQVLGRIDSILERRPVEDA